MSCAVNCSSLLSVSNVRAKTRELTSESNWIRNCVDISLTSCECCVKFAWSTSECDANNRQRQFTKENKTTTMKGRSYSTWQWNDGLCYQQLSWHCRRRLIAKEFNLPLIQFLCTRPGFRGIESDQQQWHSSIPIDQCHDLINMYGDLWPNQRPPSIHLLHIPFAYFDYFYFFAKNL